MKGVFFEIFYDIVKLHEYGFYSNKTNFICVYQTLYMHILLLIY